jgi:hypothetical protein
MTDSIYDTQKTVPYTYLIKHTPSQKVYYGVRYAKNCNTTDLFVKYFTSSKIIKALIKEDGIQAFTIEIRKTFDNKDDAINWENKVLKRMKVVKRDDFLNQTDNKSNYKNNTWWTGKKRPHRTEEHIEKFKATFKERKRGIGNTHTLGLKHTEETKQKISESTKGKPKSEETKARMSAGMKGKTRSETHCKNLSLALKGKPGPNKGKTLSEETKRRISETKKRKHFL